MTRSESFFILTRGIASPHRKKVFFRLLLQHPKRMFVVLFLRISTCDRVQSVVSTNSVSETLVEGGNDVERGVGYQLRCAARML